MEINFLVLSLSALAALLVGFIWYNPKVFGTIWMRESGISPDKAKNSMYLVLGLSFLYSFFISMALQFIVIHQFGVAGLVGGDVSKALPSYAAFMADYGTAFRTFKHGALHGCISGLFFALPLVSINALFEGKSYKYMLVVGGYWVVSLTLMGGIICAWL